MIDWYTGTEVNSIGGDRQGRGQWGRAPLNGIIERKKVKAESYY